MFFNIKMSLLDKLSRSQEDDNTPGGILRRNILMNSSIQEKLTKLSLSYRLRAEFAAKRCKYLGHVDSFTEYLNNLVDAGEITYYMGGIHPIELVNSDYYLFLFYKDMKEFDMNIHQKVLNGLLTVDNVWSHFEEYLYTTRLDHERKIWKADEKYVMSVLSGIDDSLIDDRLVDDILDRDIKYTFDIYTRNGEVSKKWYDGLDVETQNMIGTSIATYINAIKIKFDASSVDISTYDIQLVKLFYEYFSFYKQKEIIEVMRELITDELISQHFDYMSKQTNKTPEINFLAGITPSIWDYKIFINKDKSVRSINAEISKKLKTIVNEITNDKEIAQDKEINNLDTFIGYGTSTINDQYDYFEGLKQGLYIKSRKNNDEFISDSNYLLDDFNKKMFMANILFGVKVIAVDSGDSGKEFINKFTQKTNLYINNPEIKTKVNVLNRIGIEFENAIKLSKIKDAEKEENIFSDNDRDPNDYSFPLTQTRMKFYKERKPLSGDDSLKLTTGIRDIKIPYQSFERENMVDIIHKTIMSDDLSEIIRKIVEDLRPSVNTISIILREYIAKYTDIRANVFIVDNDAASRYIQVGDDDKTSEINIRVEITPTYASSSMTQKLKNELMEKITKILSEIVVTLKILFKNRDSDIGNIYNFRLRRGDFFRDFSTNEKDINRSKYIIFSLDSNVNMDTSKWVNDVLSNKTKTLKKINFKHTISNIIVTYKEGQPIEPYLENTVKFHKNVKQNAVFNKIMNQELSGLSSYPDLKLHVAKKQYILDNIKSIYDNRENNNIRYRINQNKTENDIRIYRNLKKNNEMEQLPLHRNNIIDGDLYKFLKNRNNPYFNNTIIPFSNIYISEFKAFVNNRYNKTPYEVKSFTLCDIDKFVESIMTNKYVSPYKQKRNRRRGKAISFLNEYRIDDGILKRFCSELTYTEVYKNTSKRTKYNGGRGIGGRGIGGWGIGGWGMRNFSNKSWGSKTYDGDGDSVMGGGSSSSSSPSYPPPSIPVPGWSSRTYDGDGDFVMGGGSSSSYSSNPPQLGTGWGGSSSSYSSNPPQLGTGWGSRIYEENVDMRGLEAKLNAQIGDILQSVYSPTTANTKKRPRDEEDEYESERKDEKEYKEEKQGGCHPVLQVATDLHKAGVTDGDTAHDVDGWVNEIKIWLMEENKKIPDYSPPDNMSDAELIGFLTESNIFYEAGYAKWDSLEKKV